MSNYYYYYGGGRYDWLKTVEPTNFLKIGLPYQAHPLHLQHQATTPPSILEKFKRADILLNEVKAEMDPLMLQPETEKKLFQILSSIDMFKGLRKKVEFTYNAQIVTNAWLKMYELLNTMNFNNTSQAFCNCELPGGFISAINHFNYTMMHYPTFNWVASSLYPSSETDALEDHYGLYQCNPDNWLMQSPLLKKNMDYNNGDVTIASNVKNLALRATQRLTPIHLYTADGGINVGHDYNKQEELNLKLHFGQALTGLLSLSKGGNMILKHYTLNHAFTLSLICVFSHFFEELYITKPTSSRPTNSETYIVGKNRLRLFTPKEEQVLLKRLEFFNDTPLVDLSLYQNLLESVYFAVETIHLKQQIEFLNFGMKCYRHFYNKIKLLNDYLAPKKKIFQDRWRVLNKLYVLEKKHKLKLCAASQESVA
ncbi:pEP424R [African swine fever virus]|uniref:Probable methyltransferase EP424R n=1 Tax=African swine fever virus TaxID=10497 RepID=A0A856Z147_ASF|nr:pEP424R [African swine fever virus]